MITLSEAIQYFEEQSSDESCRHRAEYAQLAEWLKELQLRRFAAIQPVYNPFKPVYNPCDYLQFRNDFNNVNPF